MSVQLEFDFTFSGVARLEITPPAPDEEAICKAEMLLEMVKNGEVYAFFAGCLMSEDQVVTLGTASMMDNVTKTLGAMEIVKQRLIREMEMDGSFG